MKDEGKPLPFNKKPLGENNLITEDYQKPTPITVQMPVGNADKMEDIQNKTVLITIVGMCFLLYELLKKAQDKVQVVSKF
mmetsp:Transcript_15973/g.24767  ORF Transcript_15973/g.24767 Transcript_15973/m.24767 type:complete len:80 (+) Transcript_15973:627-866(+)